MKWFGKEMTNEEFARRVAFECCLSGKYLKETKDICKCFDLSIDDSTIEEIYIREGCTIKGS